MTCLVLWNQLNSNSRLQKRWYNKTEILSNILHKNILNEQLFILTYSYLRKIFSLKKSSTFANLLMGKPDIDLVHLVFYKQPVYEQLALAWPIAKQLSGLNPLSLSNNKNNSLKVTSATNQWLLKMRYLRHRLRIFLFRRKVIFRSQNIQVFVFLTIPRSTKSVTSWWALVHETRCIF